MLYTLSPLTRLNSINQINYNNSIYYNKEIISYLIITLYEFKIPLSVTKKFFIFLFHFIVEF